MRRAVSSLGEELDEQLELLPGFRFHPTDEEIITHYLSPKVLDSTFRAQAIAEVDLNKCEPWELPRRAKMGEKEWYFFCLRDRKYPTGLRTNRATDAGYWKATGKDKEIYRLNMLVGMKKTLVFYKGRAPKGQKTDWVMHEYRLEADLSMRNIPKTAKVENEWVICRVFEKGPGGKKTHISGFVKMSSELNPSTLPPLMDSSETQKADQAATSSHVTCFSKPMNNVAEQDDSKLFASHSSYDSLDVHSNMENLLCSDYGLGHPEQSLMGMLLENYGPASGASIDFLDSMWKY